MGITGLDPYAIIATLALAPHPEGGWHRETFRDSPPGGVRGALTQIYYLLRKGERSRWHRIDAIEFWHFYAGEPLMLHIAEYGAAARRVVLGTGFADGQMAHAVVPARAWQAAEPLGAFALARLHGGAGFPVSPASSWRRPDGDGADTSRSPS
jgi:uncharacterized protein